MLEFKCYNEQLRWLHIHKNEYKVVSEKYIIILIGLVLNRDINLICYKLT